MPMIYTQFWHLGTLGLPRSAMEDLRAAVAPWENSMADYNIEVLINGISIYWDNILYREYYIWNIQG